MDWMKSCTPRMGLVNNEEGYMTEKSRSTALKPALIAKLYIKYRK